MIVETLDGKKYKWIIRGAPRDNASKHHIKVREFLKTFYSAANIVEEIPIKVIHNKNLYLDFYIPLYKIAIEADGKQHREFNSHFYPNKLAFINAQKNDQLKENWCKLNDITLVRFLDNESTTEWTRRLY